MRKGSFCKALMQGGHELVQGYIIGHFGVARGYHWWKRDTEATAWGITHIPTGTAVRPEFAMLRDARAFCEALDTAFDWGFQLGPGGALPDGALEAYAGVVAKFREEGML